MTTIQTDLRQSKPFPTKGVEATVALARTASLVKHAMERDLEVFGVTLQQFNVLRILRGAGESLPTMEIGCRMIERDPGISRLLSRLETKDLIVRKRCTEDARRIWIEISKKGLALLDEIGELPAWGLRKPIRDLGQEELTAFVTTLDKIRAAMPE